MLKYITTHTAFKFNNTPTLFSNTHLILLISIFSICFILAYILRNTNERQNDILLFSLGLTLLIAEIYKFFFYYYNVGNNHIVWKVFPLSIMQFSYVYLFDYPIHKKRSHQKSPL